ncbi:MAG: hypothetical protein R3B13_21885 [Polyangiaceae bacterium]
MSRRTRTLHNIQRRLERIYGLESRPNVVDFVRTANDGGRETLLLREHEDALEIALLLPPGEPMRPGGCDLWFQIAEGVSHFVYVTERARTRLPATQLELELQAEVDKFVLLADEQAENGRRLRERLFENVSFLHPEDSEAGQRYRMANDLAARFVSRLMAMPNREERVKKLRRFYRAGQAEKIRLARAA